MHVRIGPAQIHGLILRSSRPRPANYTKGRIRLTNGPPARCIGLIRSAVATRPSSAINPKTKPQSLQFAVSTAPSSFSDTISPTLFSKHIRHPNVAALPHHRVNNHAPPSAVQSHSDRRFSIRPRFILLTVLLWETLEIISHKIEEKTLWCSRWRHCRFISWFGCSCGRRTASIEVISWRWKG